MTQTIDGRRASGTALVARACVEAVLRHPELFDVTFLHFEESDDPIYRSTARDVIFPTFRIRFLNRRAIRQLWYFLTTKEKFDIIHWYQPRLYPFFWLAPAKHIVVTVHGAGDITDNKVNFVLSRFIYNQTLKIFRHFVRMAIAGSEFARKDIERRYGFKPSQTIAINNGVDAGFIPANADAVEKIREKYALPDGKFFLGVGRLIPNKNVPHLLRAFEKFCHEHADAEIKFVHVGTRGSERALVDEIMARSPYRERMQLLGYVEQDDLPVLYSAAHALVFPLLNEGFGLPAIEAMACGTATVISKTALPDIPENAAVFVDALDEDDISRGMSVIASDDDLRISLALNGPEVAKQFSWKITGDKVVELYRELAR